MRISTHSVTIDAPAGDVFRYVSDVSNMPEWAVNFTQGLRRDGERWIVTTPFGETPVAVEADAADGHVDFLYGEDGRDVAYSRVLPVGGGAHYTFTFVLPPDVPAEEFERGKTGMDEELAVLKGLLEAA